MLVGDVLLAIDGSEVKNQNAITRAIREGGSRKTVKLKRGETELELTLDWSDDPDEPRRLKQSEERAARDAARKAERESKEAAEKAKAQAEQKIDEADRTLQPKAEEASASAGPKG
jgi:hypothetical protein